MPSTVQDVIKHANFGEDWLRDFGVARGRILAFTIHLLRRLYNTLALPCKKLHAVYPVLYKPIDDLKQQKLNVINYKYEYIR